MWWTNTAGTGIINPFLIHFSQRGSWASFILLIFRHWGECKNCLPGNWSLCLSYCLIDFLSYGRQSGQHLSDPLIRFGHELYRGPRPGHGRLGLNGNYITHTWSEFLRPFAQAIAQMYFCWLSLDTWADAGVRISSLPSSWRIMIW